jgi:hypothetical protein
LLGNTIIWHLGVAIAFSTIGYRIYERRKTKHWVEIVGTIERTESILLGEDPTPFIDVVYYYENERINVDDVNTLGFRTEDFLPGSEIRLLVDPENPKICRVKQPASP